MSTTNLLPGLELAGDLPVGIASDYVRARPRSLAFHRSARGRIPGGETRAVTYYPPFPAAICSGQGPRLVDLDGHEYLDLVNNYTSLVHGNAHPALLAAAHSALDDGTAFASLHEAQYLLADALATRVASVDLVRFTNSGSEAAALAARIARRATRRRTLVLAEGGYHGAVPPFTRDEPEVVRVPFNDVDALATAVTGDTAAVFLEPFLGSGGVIPAAPGYLVAAVEIAHAEGALFVLDEVQALRNGYRGEQGRHGITPDLTLFAKVIGGGFPIGAVGGRADYLELTAPSAVDRVEHAGTFNGHLAASRAGLVSLDLLDEAAIARLDARAGWLAGAIEDVAASEGIAASVTRSGSILNVHPGATPPTSPGAASSFPGVRAALHIALLLEGVYTTPRGMINLSTVLTDADLGDVVAGYRRAFEALSDAGARPGEPPRTR